MLAYISEPGKRSHILTHRILEQHPTTRIVTYVRIPEIKLDPRVTHREWGDIPGCKKSEPQKTFCEENNIDVKITDYSEFLTRMTNLYLSGKLPYEEFRRRTWNYGRIRPTH